MAVGAVGAYGGVSALYLRPYVYNMNTVSAGSMNKLSRISDDVLDKKIDYSGLTDESLNENPLRKGQTLDFQGILDMQMQRGRGQAARIMKPVESAADAGQRAIARTESATVQRAAEDRRGNRTAEETAAADDGSNINYQMQQALRAYEMFMTA